MLGFTVAVLVAVCTLEGFDLWWRHTAALRAGESRAKHLSLVLAEYLRGSFAVADTALRQLAVHSRRIGGPDAPVAEWDGILAAARAAMPVGGTGSISVADAAGIIRQSTMKNLVGQPRREQHIFQRLSRPGPDELTMDAPFLVPRGEAQRYILPLGRRLTTAQGAFDGVIVTTFEIRGVPQVLRHRGRGHRLSRCHLGLPSGRHGDLPDAGERRQHRTVGSRRPA